MFKNRLLAAASAFVLLSSPALAQTVLTANIEPATTWVRNFNRSTDIGAPEHDDFIYEPLVIFNALGASRIFVWRKASAGGRSEEHRFQAAADLKWSDGKPLTAEDVIFTYDFLKKFPALDFVSIWKLMTASRRRRTDRALQAHQPDRLRRSARPGADRARTCLEGHCRSGYLRQ